MASLFMLFSALSLLAILFCLWPMIVARKNGVDGVAGEALDGVLQEERQKLNIMAYRQEIAALEADPGIDPEERQTLVNELKLALAEDEEQYSTVQEEACSGPEYNNVLAAIVCIGLLLAMPGYYYLYDHEPVERFFFLEKQSGPLLSVMMGEADATEEMQRDLTIFDAIVVLQRYLQREPGDVQAWVQLSIVYSELEAWEQAVFALDRALELDPVNVRFLLLKAQFLVAGNGGNFNQEVMQLLHAIIRLDSMNLGAHMLMGAAMIQGGEPQRAIETWQAFLERLPEDSRFRPMLEQSIEGARQQIREQGDEAG